MRISDWSSDVCSSDLDSCGGCPGVGADRGLVRDRADFRVRLGAGLEAGADNAGRWRGADAGDRTARLASSDVGSPSARLASAVWEPRTNGRGMLTDAPPPRARTMAIRQTCRASCRARGCMNFLSSGWY